MQDFASIAPEGGPPEAPRGYFLSLGAGRHQVPVIAAARRLGFPVVAVDRDLKAPGFERAAVQLQCSIVRTRRILEMLRENLTPLPIAGVACRSFGRAGLTAAILARRYETPGNDPGVLRKFQNKRRLKTLLARAGIPIPPVFAYGTLVEREALRTFGETLLVRPATGHGKLGLRLLTDEVERGRFLQIHLRDRGELLVEALVPGQEVTVLGIVQDGRYAPVCLSDKRVSQGPPLFIELGHDFPALVSTQERATIDDHMQTIVDATGLRSGPIVAEFILRERATPGPASPREALLVECAPEIGGEYLADVLVPAMLGDEIPADPLTGQQPDRPRASSDGLQGVDYFEELVRLLTGGVFRTEPFAAALDNPRRQVAIRFVPQATGVLKSIALPDELRKAPGLLYAKLLKAAGATLSLEGGNPDRLAVFALAARLPAHDPHSESPPQADTSALRDRADRLVREIQSTVFYE